MLVSVDCELVSVDVEEFVCPVEDVDEEFVVVDDVPGLVVPFVFSFGFFLGPWRAAGLPPNGCKICVGVYVGSEIKPFTRSLLQLAPCTEHVERV